METFYYTSGSIQLTAAVVSPDEYPLAVLIACKLPLPPSSLCKVNIKSPASLSNLRFFLRRHLSQLSTELQTQQRQANNLRHAGQA